MTHRLFLLNIIFFLTVSIAVAKSKSDQVLEPPVNARDVNVNGRVFLDANGNGKRDAGEKGVSGVKVSDGKTIIVTDNTGKYSFKFKIDGYRHVFICRPAGYKATSSWFKTIKQDHTAVNYDFNFGLQKDTASLRSKFKFAVIADPQFSSKSEAKRFKQDIQQLGNAFPKPAFAVNCGDLVQTGWLNEWKWYVDATNKLPFPYYNVFGGHGGNYAHRAKLDKSAGIHHFDIFCGPSCYSWDYGDYHFVVMTSLKLAKGYMSKAAVMRQREWLKRDLGLLKPGTKVITFSHYPLPVKKWRNDLRQVASFYGHMHENIISYNKKVPFICTNPTRNFDWGAFTSVYRLCTLDNGKLTTTVRPLGQYQYSRFIQPHDGQKIFKATIPLRVSVYDSRGKVTEVNVAIKETNGDIVKDFTLKKMGQFTWGTNWDISDMAGASYAMILSVKDENNNIWPTKKCEFKISKRPMPKVKLGENWPMFFKSLKELRTSSQELLPPLQLKWSIATSGANQMVATPIIYKGKIFFAPENFNIGAIKPSIRSYDAYTGKKDWKVEIDSWAHFSPAAFKNMVYVQSGTGTVVYCLNAGNGQEVWKSRPVPNGGNLNAFDAKTPILLYNNKLITYCEHGPVKIYDYLTGKLISQWEIPDTGKGNHYGGIFPYKNNIFIGTTRNAIACELTSGRQIWKVSTRSVSKRRCSIGIVHNGIYYIQCLKGMIALRASDGKVVWKLKMKPQWGIQPVPTIAGDIIYTGGKNTQAINIKTGKIIWQYSHSNKPRNDNRRQAFCNASSPLVSGNVLYTGCDDGYIIALNKNTGELIWKFPLGTPIKSSPVISGNSLYISDYDGNLHCFTTKQ